MIIIRLISDGMFVKVKNSKVSSVQMPDHFFCIVLRDLAGNIDFFLSEDPVSTSGIFENI